MIDDVEGRVTEVRHPRHFAEAGDFRTTESYTARGPLASTTTAAGAP